MKLIKFLLVMIFSPFILFGIVLLLVINNYNETK